MADDASQAALILSKQLRGMSRPRTVPTAIANRLTRFAAAADLQKNPVDGFSAGLVDDGNLFEWDVVVMGPPDTP